MAVPGTVYRLLFSTLVLKKKDNIQKLEQLQKGFPRKIDGYSQSD